MKKKKVLVTGGTGVVASYVNEAFSIKYDCVLLGKNKLDITDKKIARKVIKEHAPDLLIHLAAETNVDYCEQNPKEAFKINANGTKNIADACKTQGIPLIYISTSAVFDGTKKGFNEKDKTNPVNTYGTSKLEGEKYIRKELKKYYIVRAGWMIGGGRKEKKFISYIIEQASKNMNMRVVSDKFGTITYARELIDFLMKIYEERYSYGIYHFGSKGICSRFDIAKEILKIINKDLQITPVPSSEFAGTFFAPRPQFEVILSKKHNFQKNWRKSLKNYLINEII
jgi:dTDP-4-dehydrorhamnose reductase